MENMKSNMIKHIVYSLFIVVVIMCGFWIRIAFHETDNFLGFILALPSFIILGLCVSKTVAQDND